MRSGSRVEGPVPFPEAQETFVHVDLLYAVEESLVGQFPSNRIRMHIHDANFHQVEGKSSKRADEAGNATGSEGAEIMMVGESLFEELLSLVIRSQKTRVHTDGSPHDGNSASPETEYTLFTGDLPHGLECIVVSTFQLRRGDAIGLHAHKGNIEGIAHNASQRASSHATERLFPQWNGINVLFLLQSGRERVKDAQTSSAVNRLSHEGGRKTVVEAQRSLPLVDVLHHSSEGGRDVAALGRQEDTCFNHIERENLTKRRIKRNIHSTWKNTQHNRQQQMV